MKGHMTIYQTEDWSVLSKVDPTKDELFIAAVESSKKEKESRADDDEFRKKLEEALENAGPRAAIANWQSAPMEKEFCLSNKIRIPLGCVIRKVCRST